MKKTKEMLDGTHKRSFKGLSDFFLNATEEEHREVMEEVAKRATEAQLEVIKKANE